MQKYTFAFVSNSPEIGETVKLYSDPATEEVIVRLATMEEAIPVARGLLDEGVDVILGGGGPAGRRTWATARRLPFASRGLLICRGAHTNSCSFSRTTSTGHGA